MQTVPPADKFRQRLTKVTRTEQTMKTITRAQFLQLFESAICWWVAINMFIYGGAKYMQTHAFKYQSEKYIEVMTQYTDFPVQIGPELSEYYSNNWNNIVWHKESKKWITQ